MSKLIVPARNNLGRRTGADGVYVVLPLLDNFLHELLDSESTTALFVVVRVLSLAVKISADAWWGLSEVLASMIYISKDLLAKRVIALRSGHTYNLDDLDVVIPCCGKLCPKVHGVEVHKRLGAVVDGVDH